jgi:uncharacterized protein with GYD domain
MPTYIVLLTLTPEGREKMLEDPHSVLRAEESVNTPNVQSMGLYGVLGDYDFFSILEASDNETVARFSLEFGVKAGVHVTTLPVIPLARLKGTSLRDVLGLQTGAAQQLPEEAAEIESPS